MATAGAKKGGKGKKGKDDCLPTTLFHTVAENLGRDWRKLGRIMGIKDTAIESIAEKCPGDLYEMGYKVLTEWKQKLGKKATQKMLQQHLQSINRNDIVETITTFSDSKSAKEKDTLKKDRRSKEVHSDILKDVQDKLMDEYLNLTMNGLPWMDELVLPLDEYFVELSLTKMDKLGIELTSEQINIEEIFNSVNEIKIPNRILVEGGPGMGKSTLVAKLAYDWAKGKEYIKHFDLVVLIPLRHFDGQLLNIFCNAMAIKEHECKRILSMSENKSKHILFVMDGFDEISPDMKNVVLPMLQRKVYSHTAVIVTSRTGKFQTHMEGVIARRMSNHDFSSTSSNFIQKRIKVKGFNDEQKDAFTKKHTQNCSEEEKQKIALKLEKMVDTEFLKCPLFLLMLIVTLTENLDKENISETKTDLYKQVFNCVIRRYFSKLKHDDISNMDLFSYTGGTKSLCIELMEQFSKFCLWAISTHRVSFSYDDIMKYTNNDSQILQLGFLTQSVTIKRLCKKLVYEPVHKSLLEFAAAYSSWLTFLEHNCENKEWKHKVIATTQILPDSLCFAFLLGLMGKNAHTIFNVLRPTKWFYSLKFRNWCSVLLEMEITDSTLKTLSHFLPPVWHFGWDYTDSGIPVYDKQEAVVQSGMQEGRIQQIKWDVLHDTLIPKNISVETLVLWNTDDFRNTCVNQLGISKEPRLIQCKNLWCHFRCYFQADVFTQVLQVIEFKHLSISLHSKMLSDVEHFLIAENFKNHRFYWVIVATEVDSNEQQLVDKGIEIINSRRITRIGLHVWKPIRQTLFDKLITAAASSQLAAFTLMTEPDTLSVDIGDLCRRGKKSWEWLDLKGVNIECKSELHKHITITCLELTATNVSDRTEHFMSHCKVKSLTCTASLLFGCLDSWPVCKTLTELYVVVDESMVKDGISTHVALIRNLQILGLIMSPNYSIPCHTEEWLLGSQNCLRLTGIEICGTNENKELAMEVVEGIAKCLPEEAPRLKPSSATSQCSNSSHKTIHLQYLMVNNRAVYDLNPLGESGSFLDFARILKCSLASKQLPRLEIVSVDVPSVELSSWLEEFPFEEGFRIDYDIWGDKKEDTIRSKMTNDCDPGSVKRIVIAADETVPTTPSKKKNK